MLTVEIPGAETLHLEHLVVDFNGTLACDGALLDGVSDLLRHIASRLYIHVVTGDIFGRAAEALEGLPCKLVILGSATQSEAKRDYVQRLGTHSVVCIGNGVNDRLMLQDASLGIAVVQAEGASALTLAAADVVTGSIDVALGLLLHPRRLAATLRT